MLKLMMESEEKREASRELTESGTLNELVQSRVERGKEMGLRERRRINGRGRSGRGRGRRKRRRRSRGRRRVCERFQSLRCDMNENVEPEPRPQRLLFLLLLHR